MLDSLVWPRRAHNGLSYRVSLASSVALAAVMLAPLHVQPAAAQDAPLAQPVSVIRTFNFNVPQQSLATALVRFSKITGVGVIADHGVIPKVASAGVAGNLTAEQALEQILAGSGVRYRFTNGKMVTLHSDALDARAQSTELDPISVEGRAALQQEGAAKDGYRVRTVSNVGPLGALPLQDTPFTVSVIPRELIQNIQAQSPDDIYRINPTTRTSTPQVTTWTPVTIIRGFGVSNIAHDGLRRPTNHGAVVEDKERVEIFSGPTGFLYGATAPGGMINFVYKRPTKERYNSVTVGNYGGEQGFVHGDFGGPIDAAGKAGYRLNVVKQNGNTAVDDQSIDRALISGAFDWQVTEKLKLELNASYSKYRTEGSSAYWFYGAGIARGPAPDASKNWGQPWIKDQLENTMAMGKLTYQLTDNITLRGAYMRELADRPIQDHTMNSMDTSGTYSQLRQRSGRTYSYLDSAQALVDVEFRTGPAKHKITAGYYGTSEKYYSTGYAPHTGWVGPYSVSGGPTYVPEFNFPPDTTNGPYNAGTTRNHNFVFGDLIEFSEQWSALAGINYSRITSTSLDVTGSPTTPAYGVGRISPTMSVIYKPVPWLTTYVSYIEGLEQGGIAPDGTVNQGAIMTPMVTQQKEIGVKATVGGVLLTAALFDIQKAYEFTDGSNIYTQDGRQRHQGVEFTATGKVTDRLTMVGGLTLLDAKVINSEFNGLEPQNVASMVAKIYSEYELPFMNGLFLTGGVYYTGEQWGDAANLDRVPAYTTVDLGARYATKIYNNPLTLRLNVSNIEDKSYWINSYYVGQPRTVAFSAQMQF